MKNNKGQAQSTAMEFLMNYGWAILAAIIGIGILAYLGVFNSGKYVEDITFNNECLAKEFCNVVNGELFDYTNLGNSLNIECKRQFIDDNVFEIKTYSVSISFLENKFLWCKNEN